MDALPDESPSFWRSPAGRALAVIVAVGGSRPAQEQQR
jgi:hypothetical protein